jgi:hypothetical protein
MKVKVRFKQINEGFSQDWADFHEEGKESLQNPKHKWEHGFVSEGIEEIDLSPSEDYTFIGVDPDGNEKGLMLPNMCVLRCFHEIDKSMTTYLISNSILSTKPNFQGKTNYTNKSEQSLYQYFYIKPDAEFVQLQPGWLVNVNELPIELRA